MQCKVGLPTDGQQRWRCGICSQLNLWDRDSCKRCDEPVDLETKHNWKIKCLKRTLESNSSSDSLCSP